MSYPTDSNVCEKIQVLRDLTTTHQACFLLVSHLQAGGKLEIVGAPDQKTEGKSLRTIVFDSVSYEIDKKLVKVVTEALAEHLDDLANEIEIVASSLPNILDDEDDR